MTYPTVDAGTTWLTWTGLETDLIFNHGVDLPGFAAFPLLETEEGRAWLRKGYCDLIAVASQTGCGACLESVTWMANPDRAAPLGYGRADLARVNRDAIAFMEQITSDVPICLSAQIGPRGDGYAVGEMTRQSAHDYHLPQVEMLAATSAHLLSAFTISSTDEATGLVMAAGKTDLPITVAFTVETDGCLPDKTPLAQAIDRVDQATSGGAAYFLINCAHPDHLIGVLDGSAPLNRIAGIVANASRQSHTELDEAKVLDDGNPAELGRQLADIFAAHPWMRVFGGCCGTDMRHMRSIAQACTS